jgi:hypothetical protein
MNSNMIQPIAIAARVNFIFSEFRIVFSFVSNSPNLGLVHYGMDVVDTPNRADLSLLMATNSQQIVRHRHESCVQCFVVH